MSQMMGMMGGGGGKGGGKGKGKGKGAQKKQKMAPPTKKIHTIQKDLPWKSRLAQAYSGEHKAGLTKDSFVYTTCDIEGGTFVCTLTSDRFACEYSCEEAYDSQKVAEEAVAMAALMAEFPLAYGAIPMDIKQKGVRASQGTGNHAIKQEHQHQTAKPAKRKAPQDPFGAGPGPTLQAKGTFVTDAKSRLNTGITILAERPLTKADTAYVTEENDGSYATTLTFHCFDGQTPFFTGEPATTKKQAEQNAAEAAMTGFQAQIDAKMPEHEAKKEARKLEHQAKKHAKMQSA